MRDEIFDIVLMVLVLGIVVNTGYTVLKRTESNLYKDKEIVYEDKNTNTKMGEDVLEYGEYDGTLSKYDLVLITQVQDFYMPEPKSFTIGNDRIDIISTYESELHKYATSAWKAIQGFNEETRFTVEFSSGIDMEDESDDTFQCSKVE